MANVVSAVRVDSKYGPSFFVKYPRIDFPLNGIADWEGETLLDCETLCAPWDDCAGTWQAKPALHIDTLTL